MWWLLFCIPVVACVQLGWLVHKLRCRLDAICNIADEFLADLEDPNHA